MAGATVSFQMNSATEPFGTLAVGPVTVTGTITPVPVNVSLASGANTVSVPTGSSGFVLSPPSTNTFTLTLKGVSGDTGVSLPKTVTSIYFFDPASVPANIVITAGGATGSTDIVFF